MTNTFEEISFDSIEKHHLLDINTILSNAENSTIFHTLDWSEILKKQFGIVENIIIFRENEEPIGLFKYSKQKKYLFLNMMNSPTMGLESPYGGPVFLQNNNNNFIESISQIEKKLMWPSFISFQLTGYYDVKRIEKMGYTQLPIYTSILNLDKSENLLWDGLNKKTRNLTRKATKAGIEIKEGGIPDIKEYYKMILSTFSKANIKTLPVSFYENVFKTFFPKNKVKLFLAKYEGKYIAGAIILTHNDSIYYWHGASFREFLSYAPNNLLQWEIIKWANMAGYKKYDFVMINEKTHPGIAAFKLGWGGNLVKLNYIYKFNTCPFLNQVLTKKVMKRA